MLKVVSAGTLSPICGLVIMAVIMFFEAGILPIGIPLQEPAVICRPFVMVWPEQKLMKLALSLLHSKLADVVLLMKADFGDLRC